jgi:hypothetical protein
MMLAFIVFPKTPTLTFGKSARAKTFHESLDSRYGVVVLVKSPTKIRKLFQELFVMARTPTDSQDVTVGLSRWQQILSSL